MILLTRLASKSEFSALMLLVFLTNIVAETDHLFSKRLKWPLTTECKLDLYRLPNRVQVKHYKLHFDIEPNQDRHKQFDGRVEIDIIFDAEFENNVLCSNRKSNIAFVACRPNRIVLHAAKSITIHEIRFHQGSQEFGPSRRDEGSAGGILNVCRDLSTEMIAIDLIDTPKDGSFGKLLIEFSGQIQNDGSSLGIFESFSQPQSGMSKGHRMVVTQFEATYARSAFPCFDEPMIKATFDVSIDHDAALTALANTPVLRTELLNEGNAGNRLRVYFERTPKMSTYLLAFALGQFDSVSGVALGLQINIYTPPGRALEAHKSLNIALYAYEKLSQYFEIDQPLKKIDFLTFNKDSTALENWGLITFEEDSMLSKFGNLGPDTAHWLSLTIFHELSHHWFGNLVTMKWWDDLWLNEGFASWIASEFIAQYYPHKFNGEMFYLLNSLTRALAQDAFSSTHPIKNFKLQSPVEIEKAFDIITYEKSNCLIRMLNNFVGSEPFKLGIQSYIKEHMFSNTEDSDLWSALEQVSGNQLKVGDFMYSWLHQAGHPIIEASLSSFGSLLVLKQRRFTYVGSRKSSRTQLLDLFGLNKQAQQLSPIWIIPVTILLSDSSSKTIKIKHLLDKRKDSIKLPNWFKPGKPGHWLKMNANFEGFYRVHYKDPRLFSALQAPVESRMLNPAVRLNLIDESMALFKAGLIEAKKLRELLSWFKDETHDGVVIAITRLLSQVSFVSDTSILSSREGKKFNPETILMNYFSRTGGMDFDLDIDKDTVDMLKIKARIEVIETLAIDRRTLKIIGMSYSLWKQLTAGGKTNTVIPYWLMPSIFTSVGILGTNKEFELAVEAISQVESVTVRSNLFDLLKYVLVRANNLNRAQTVSDKNYLLGAKQDKDFEQLMSIARVIDTDAKKK